MICIIDIDHEHSKQISSILTRHSIKSIISNDEQKIISCNKIIIPDTCNVQVSLQKIKLMNLMSALRIINKPLLGINQGMVLMCNNIQEISKIGLGLINEDSIKLSDNIEGIYSIININNNDGFVKKQDYFFRTNYAIAKNKYSKTIIEINGTLLTAVYHKQNIFGIQMCLDNSKNLGEDLILSFADL